MGIFTISDQGYKKTLTLQSPADLRVVETMIVPLRRDKICYV